jgi:hypothetical protein
MTTTKDFSPAAVLGTSIHLIDFALDSENYIQFWRQGKRTGTLRGGLRIRNPKLYNAIVNNPKLSQYSFIQTWKAPYSASAKDLAYEDALLILAEALNVGYSIPNGLLAEQARVAAMGVVPLDCQAAYLRHLQAADDFLVKVISAGFKELAKNKGLRTVTAPRRARAVTSAAKGVHVFPDAYNERYVNIDLYTLSEETYLGLRDLAFEHYEPLGLRPYLARR